MNVINYDTLKATGWTHSVVNSVKTLGGGSASDASAVVALDFSRINSKGEAFLTTTGYYSMTQTVDGGWKINILTLGKSVVGVDEDDGGDKSDGDKSDDGKSDDGKSGDSHSTLEWSNGPPPEGATSPNAGANIQYSRDW